MPTLLRLLGKGETEMRKAGERCLTAICFSQKLVYCVYLMRVYYVLNCVLCGCRLCTQAVQYDMGWCYSMAGSSPECSFGKVHMTSMQGTIYLLGTKYHVVLTQTAPAALHMGTVLHMIYGKTAFQLQHPGNPLLWTEPVEGRPM